MSASIQHMNNDMDIDTSMDIDTPRDVRLLHLLLASQAIHQYEERVPLQLMDFAYRYTKGILKDAMIYNDYKVNNLVEDTTTTTTTTSNKEINVDNTNNSNNIGENSTSGNMNSTGAPASTPAAAAAATTTTSNTTSNSTTTTTTTTSNTNANANPATSTTTNSTSNTGSGSSNLTPGQLTVEDIRLAIASRTQYQFKPTAPKELLLKLASERNKKSLPQVMGLWGVRLPPEKYCLTAKEWRINQHK